VWRNGDQPPVDLTWGDDLRATAGLTWGERERILAQVDR
jgi:hypothetical protein